MNLFLEFKEKELNLKNFKTLPLSFYRRNTLTVAKELLGKYIIKIQGDRFLVGKITETEAYLGHNDPASHSFGKITKRNAVMYEDGGIGYVYFIYGNYFCFNVVTEKKGTGSAVLIRAVEPVAGIKSMLQKRKSIKNFHELTNGPAKFCLAFGIDRKYNGERLDKKYFFISRSVETEKFTVITTKRIGIKKG